MSGNSRTANLGMETDTLNTGTSQGTHSPMFGKAYETYFVDEFDISYVSDILIRLRLIHKTRGDCRSCGIHW